MTELVISRDRHLKWRSLDGVERVLMILCGIFLAAFATSVFFDVLTRELGAPWLWLQEVTSAFFTYGIFCGTAVAVRRQDHLQLSALTELMHGRMRTIFETSNRVVILLVGAGMVVFGWQNFLQGFHSFRMPSMTPIAYLYWPIPVCGLFIILFSVEQIVNGLKNGYEGHPESPRGTGGH